MWPILVYKRQHIAAAIKFDDRFGDNCIWFGYKWEHHTPFKEDFIDLKFCFDLSVVSAIKLCIWNIHSNTYTE